jgi:hypothetical protein
MRTVSETTVLEWGEDDHRATVERWLKQKEVRARYSRIVANPSYRIMEGLPVDPPAPAVTRIADYIVRTARNRALPSATRS